jgi:hypothetical protein
VKLVAWMLIGTGVLTLASIPVLARRGRRTAWIEVPGAITQSEVRRNGELYEPFIRYEYVVQSRTYTGATVRSALVSYNWSGPARRICERYPVGAKISVYVDPEQPGNAVLEFGSRLGGMVVICLASAILVISGGMLLGR